MHTGCFLYLTRLRKRWFSCIRYAKSDQNTEGEGTSAAVYNEGDKIDACKAFLESRCLIKLLIIKYRCHLAHKLSKYFR